MKANARAVILAGLAASLVLAGCQSRRPPPRPALEPVLTWYVQGEDLFVRVQSGGCTNKSSFDPQVYMAPRRWAAEVELVRIAEDYCEAFMPNGVLISWTRDELGVPETAGIELVNPTRAQAPYSG